MDLWSAQPICSTNVRCGSSVPRQTFLSLLCACYVRWTLSLQSFGILLIKVKFIALSFSNLSVVGFLNIGLSLGIMNNCTNNCTTRSSGSMINVSRSASDILLSSVEYIAGFLHRWLFCGNSISRSSRPGRTSVGRGYQLDLSHWLAFVVGDVVESDGVNALSDLDCVAFHILLSDRPHQ